MKNLKFKSASAWNFLPFGPEGISINFENYGNIILVRGENRDARQLDANLASDEMKISSNGTGKSSIQEIVVYALFGKTIKRPEKLGANDVVHNKIGRDAKVELIFDDIKIVRVRKEGGSDKKNSLKVWQSAEGVWDKSTEITQGTMAATQEKIESLIGLSYEAFVNIAIFTDDQRACFLECENKQKKEIVENMLSLGAYRQWFENAKSLRKEIKNKVDVKSKEYSMLLNSKDDAVRRLNITKEKDKKWRIDKTAEVEAFKNKIDALMELLGKSDNGNALVAYENAQLKIKEINQKIPEIEKTKSDAQAKLKVARDKESLLKNEASDISGEYQTVLLKTKNLTQGRKSKEAEIEHLKSHDVGGTCDKCHGTILQENIQHYADTLQTDISKLNEEINACVKEAKEIQDKAKKVKENQEKIKKYVDQFLGIIQKAEEELSQLQTDLIKASQVKEPKVDNEQALLQEKIASFKEQMSNVLNELKGDSPFNDILINDQQELDKIIQQVEQKDAEVKLLEADLPYYDFWVTGFGEHGIRKWVVDGIIPELNNRINYWLQFLIDNRITLKFDNELNEIIERNPVDGDPYIYHAMSTGQRRRLNLAVSQAFAHVMMLSTGAVPSIIFLDEVTTNVDPIGVQGIYNMICELACDRQVFVTTHDPDLLRMLQTADVLQMVHEQGFTTLCEKPT